DIVLQITRGADLRWRDTERGQGRSGFVVLDDEVIDVSGGSADEAKPRGDMKPPRATRRECAAIHDDHGHPRALRPAEHPRAERIVKLQEYDQVWIESPDTSPHDEWEVHGVRQHDVARVFRPQPVADGASAGRKDETSLGNALAKGDNELLDGVELTHAFA